MLAGAFSKGEVIANWFGNLISLVDLFLAMECDLVGVTVKPARPLRVSQLVMGRYVREESISKCILDFPR